MNFEPPAPVPSIIKPKGNNQFQNKNPDCSPLLRSYSPNKNFGNNGPSNHQNRNNMMNGQQQFRAPIRNRLGNRHFQKRNNNVETTQTNIGNAQGQRMFNRKRREINDGNTGPILPKRKWGGNKTFYQNSNNNLQNTNSAQNRLNRIRNNSQLGSTEQLVVKTENNTSCFNDSQEIDATDITVEVVNHDAQAQQEETPAKFKMILNPKTQAAIKMIQSKRRDKQVIFPFPVTPNVTGVSLHERFTLL